MRNNMLAFWSWHSSDVPSLESPDRTMLRKNSNTVNDPELENRTTNTDTARCTVCGEKRFERYKLVLRQPLCGSAAGRIIETGSVCEQCADKMRHNARAEKK